MKKTTKHGRLLLSKLAVLLFAAGFSGGCQHRTNSGFDAALFETLREIVKTDWQTAGAWDTDKSSTPPDATVRQVIGRSTFKWIDLNGDGQLEVLVHVLFAPGHHDNGSIYVIRKDFSGWRIIGELGGNGYHVHKAEPQRRAYLDIITTWYAGGGEHLTSTYHYTGRNYEQVKEERWSPVEIPAAGPIQPGP